MSEKNNVDNNIDSATLKILLSSLDSVHDSIRVYDSKAQIVGIGFILSLGFVTASSGGQEPSRILDVFTWLLGVIPVVMFGWVLFPSRRMAPKLGTKCNKLQRSYYVLGDRYADLDEYTAAFDKSDWKTELLYEIQKNSLLRDMKRKRFVRALAAAGISFSLMLLVPFLRSTGWFI